VNTLTHKHIYTSILIKHNYEPELRPTHHASYSPHLSTPTSVGPAQAVGRISTLLNLSTGVLWTVLPFIPSQTLPRLRILRRAGRFSKPWQVSSRPNTIHLYISPLRLSYPNICLQVKNKNYSFPQSNPHATHEVLLRKTFTIRNPKFLLTH